MNSTKNFRGSIILFLKGLLMGAADTVPGVSGGTMALMTGIYPKLITTISSFDKQFFSLLFSAKFKQAFEHIDFKFLFTLLAGIGTGIISLAGIITSMIDNQPARIFALFFGMVLGSSICIAKGIKWNFGDIVSFIVGTAIGYLLITIIPFETPHTLWILFLSGAVAITAMILPGISGAFILLILGKYDFVLSAVKAPFEASLNTPNLLILSIFGMGCICGIMCSSKAINFMLKKFPNVTMSLMLGLMAGSVWRLWPWQEEFKKLSIQSETLFPVLLIVLGLVVVFAIEILAKLSEKKQLSNNKSDIKPTVAE